MSQKLSSAIRESTLKYTKFISAFFLILILFFSYNQLIFSFDFPDLFSETEFSENGFRKATEFQTENKYLYIPGFENKEFFESIEDMSICRNEDVRKYIYFYLTSDRDNLKKSIGRSYIYIDIINSVMGKNPDIPSGIALLPLLESGFEPSAVSKSNAVGLWQFLLATSRHLGLESSSLVEERRDIEKSTEAALRHLRYLHKIFKSWDLALAAYNGGEGQVRRAMEKTGSKNIWELIASGTLVKETSEYVPRYAALVTIYNNRRLFGIENEIIKPAKEKTVTIKLDYQINIYDLSEKCGIDLNEIKKYNPQLNTSLTPSSGQGYFLRLTENSAGKFYQNTGSLISER